MSTSHIARHLTKRRKELTKFLDDLDRASGLAHGDSRLAAQTAFVAIAELLTAEPDPEAERIGGIFSKLAVQIGPNASADREARGHCVKGATAYLIEYLSSLPGQRRKVRQFALDAAHVLSERAFPFSGKHAGAEGDERGTHRKTKNPLVVARGKTIELWRRRYRTMKGNADPAGVVFKKHRSNRPFKTTENPAANARAAVAWWYAELMRNDY